MTVKNLFINQINKEGIFDYDFSSYDNICIFYRNIYTEKGMVRKSFLEIAKEYYEKYDNWQYKNIIVVPNIINKRSRLNDNLLYIIWFSSKKDPYFNKDYIREKHIWKDVEWGQRKKNYSEKGKDPSNVWIPTEDDGMGHITKHLQLNVLEIVNRLYKSMTLEDDTVVDFFNSKFFSDINQEKIISEIEKSLTKLHYREEENKTYREETEAPLVSSQKVYFTSSENIPVKSNSIQLVVTSPPYWDLKNYFKKGQIGQESYDEYLNRLNQVWSESLRVLKDDGTIWVNVNIRTKNGVPYFIPTDIIEQFKKLNSHLVDIVIWHKSSSIPVRDNNLTDKYEVFLCFSKSETPKIKTGILKKFNEYKNSMISGGIIWNINRKAGSVGKKMVHPAIYPIELIDRVIQVSTDNGDKILDPFLGSGTSLISAIKNHRDGVGIEFNEKFKELIDYRISKEVNETDFNIEYKEIDQD